MSSMGLLSDLNIPQAIRVPVLDTRAERLAGITGECR